MPLPMKERTIDETFLDSLESNPYAAAIGFYAERLGEHDKALNYLLDEYGIELSIAQSEQIGFSDRTLGKRLPTLDSTHGRKVRRQLKKAGLFKSTGHETLRGYVTFPLFGDDGQTVTGILGRRVDRHGKGKPSITIGEGTLHAPIMGEANRLEPRNPKPTAAVAATAKPKRDDDDSLVIEEDQVTFARGDRRYRIRGLEKNTSTMTLKVNVLASRDDLVYLDTLDLVKARTRASFVKAVAAELFVDVDIIKRDISQLLFKLEALRERQIAEAKTPHIKAVELTPQEAGEAMTLLRDPKLLERVVADMDACGMVGESTNKLVGYLAATSRKLQDPLAIVIQSSSSAGKTSLMDAVLSMMPDEHQVRFSGITGQSLFYLDSHAIRHNILAISEDEGAGEAAYALKLLQSEGELRHASVGRDSSGRMATQQHHVEGPVQIMLTTTAMDIDEELVNRCLVLSVDESRDQTDAIQGVQRSRRTTDAMIHGVSVERLRHLHQNAQRLLEPVCVVNPYAPQLTFPNTKTRTRRDHQKYLTLIDTVALLHQFQRSRQVVMVDGEEIEFITVEPSDIAVANRIAGVVLGRSLDELSPQTRNCLDLTERFVRNESKVQGVSHDAFRFTRRDLRASLGWSDFQVRTHLNKLVDLEYVVVHRGRQGRRFVYELLYQGERSEDGAPILVGLADPCRLKAPCTTTGSSMAS